MTLYRSWLFVPGNKESMLEKAPGLSADALVYDLEDAVPVKEKASARQLVQKSVKLSGQNNCFVRVNGLSTPYINDDIRAVVDVGLSGIILPKVVGKEDILRIDQLLTSLEKERQFNQGCFEVVPLIESALGLFNVYKIATASKRIKRLAFGSVDFTLDINTQPSKDGKEIMYARSQIVVVS